MRPRRVQSRGGSAPRKRDLRAGGASATLGAVNRFRQAAPRREVLRWTAAALAASAAPRAVAAACEIFPADGRSTFQVVRDGRAIGAHRIGFARTGGTFAVRTDVEIELTLLGATLFRFIHRAEEEWREGWLHSVVSDTDDDGKRYAVRAERRDGIFQGAVNGRGFTVSGYIIPSSLWHFDTVKVEALFDIIDARLKPVRARFLGEAPITVGGAPVTARHYRVAGGLNRDLWYDGACRLVRVGLAARDGSAVTLERL